jgi:hypothetical protein
MQPTILSAALALVFLAASSASMPTGYREADISHPLTRRCPGDDELPRRDAAVNTSTDAATDVGGCSGKREAAQADTASIKF